uniref:Uncharacterized protein n=1 Tax=Rhizophora mucronata TaxID=61149 RepID=A0A2P2JXY0_RHIMU
MAKFQVNSFPFLAQMFWSCLNL